MIEYIIGGAAVLAYVAYHGSTPERRRRWLARIEGSAAPPADITDPLPSPMDHDHGGHHDSDHGGHHDSDHGGHHGGDFDVGGHHH